MRSFLKNYSFDIVVVCFFLLFLIAELINGRFWLNDFKVYYTATQQFLSGNEIYGTPFGLGSGLYKYSPIALLPFIPFTFLPYFHACIIYYLLIVFLILCIFRFCKNQLFPISFPAISTPKKQIFFFTFLVLATHFIRETHLGNTNVLLLFVILTSLIFSIQNKKVLSGLLLATGILFKPHFCILLPLLLVRKEWKMFLSTSLFTAIGLFLSIIFIGFSKNMLLLKEWMTTMVGHNSASFDGYENTTYLLIGEILNRLGITINFQILFLGVVGIVAILFFAFFLHNIRREKLQPENKSICNQHFIVEYVLLIAVIPNLLQTDTEHFLFSLPCIFLLMSILFYTKPSIYFVVFSVIAFIFYGGNWGDLIGKSLSSFAANHGLLGIGNLLILVLLAWRISISQKTLYRL